MHMRSLKLSVEPKAQQQPQSLWSRTAPMMDAHFGQLAVALKATGSASATATRISSAANFSFCSFVPTRVPSRRLTSSTVALRNLMFSPATHEGRCALMAAMTSPVTARSVSRSAAASAAVPASASRRAMAAGEGRGGGGRGWTKR